MIMVNIGIFYATISGSTKKVANQVALSLRVPKNQIHNISEVPAEKMLEYQLIILGTPTYGKGDSHYLWKEIFAEMSSFDFEHCWFALFCLGDKMFHRETFAASLIKMKTGLLKHSEKIIGQWTDTHSYFHDSPAMLPENSFDGLILDEVSRKTLTTDRINLWTSQLEKSLEKVAADHKKFLSI